MTPIRVVDRPCGYGKSTSLIAEIKNHLIDFPDEKILLIVPELGEVKRFLKEIGDWFYEPTTNDATSKTGAITKLLRDGKNVVTTHSLYERIKKFQHRLNNYHVIIDEVPTAAKEVRTSFGSGVFKDLLHDRQFIKIDPVTKLITPTSSWLLVKNNYSTGTDVGIQKFMDTVTHNDVFYVSDTYQVMPLPEAFFTKPRSLTILTFMFKGTQLDHYITNKGYCYDLDTSPDELAQFKQEMSSNLRIHPETAGIKCGYSAMTQKEPKLRNYVGKFIRNLTRKLNKDDKSAFSSDRVLVAGSKDAWYGTEKNPNSKVTNSDRLKRTTRLSKATYTAMVTRGTNKHKRLDILILLGKLNMNPRLSDFLGMNSNKAQNSHATSELIQLIYRTAIRDKKDILLISADPENIALLREFLAA